MCCSLTRCSPPCSKVAKPTLMRNVIPFQNDRHCCAHACQHTANPPAQMCKHLNPSTHTSTPLTHLPQRHQGDGSGSDHQRSRRHGAP